jgi:hypothetical protein
MSIKVFLAAGLLDSPIPDRSLIAAESQAIDVHFIGGQSNATDQGYLNNLPRIRTRPAGVALTRRPAAFHQRRGARRPGQRADDSVSPYPKGRSHFETAGMLALDHRMADRMPAASNKTP